MKDQFDYNNLTGQEQTFFNLLQTELVTSKFSEVYLYSLLPSGKLFRPNLVFSLAKDLTPDFDHLNYQYFAFSLECHHVYSLIHDDLPAMDNDDLRRGKPSSHKKFNEWKAILAGDGLINVSYSMIAKIDINNFNKLLKYYSWCLGPKGLIEGQFRDLDEESKPNLSQTRTIHSLKTARLIQLALCGCSFIAQNSNAIINQKFTTRKFLHSLYKVGHNLGIVFQYLDDLIELTQEINEHEKLINPWLNHQTECFQDCVKRLNFLSEHISLYPELENLNCYLRKYFTKCLTTISDGEKSILNFDISIDYLRSTKLALKQICTVD